MSENKNPKRHHHVVDGEIFTTGAGTEAIRVKLDMGFINLKLVVNIPCDGEDTAPVFVTVRNTGNPKYNFEA